VNNLEILDNEQLGMQDRFMAGMHLGGFSLRFCIKGTWLIFSTEQVDFDAMTTAKMVAERLKPHVQVEKIDTGFKVHWGQNRDPNEGWPSHWPAMSDEHREKRRNYLNWDSFHPK